MAIGKLTPNKITRLSKPGKYCDGGGLYLQVGRGGAKSWLFRYIRRGIERCIGLGPLHTVGLNAARMAAHHARLRLAKGADPFQDRLLDAMPPVANDKTFDECVNAYVDSHRKGWSSAHARQWEQSLRIHISPHFGKLHVRLIGTAHILQALEPLWASNVETASRLRGRIERVLAWATISGYREGDNPARWRGHLEELLPTPGRIKKTCHFPAIPYQDIGAFVARLAGRGDKAARVLAFTILTASRSTEAIRARWDEIDLKRGIWTIPAERMKADREHRVPLARPVMGILRAQQGRDPVWVFPGNRPGMPFSKDAMLSMLRRMEPKATVHGFRSSFRVWAAEQTDYPKEIPELALAHTVGSEVEQAYQRSDLLEKRRALMQKWAKFCLKLEPDVRKCKRDTKK